MRKKIITLCIFMGLFAVSNAQTQLTGKERKDALQFYKEAASDLKKQVEGLDEAQLNWKPNDSTWSVSECVEHIALSEKSIFDWAVSPLQSPAVADKKSDKTDEEVKTMVESREKKVKTYDALQPKKQFGNTQQTLNVFNQRRTDNMKFIETTKGDLRHHFAQTPLGMLDAYQLLLFLNAHTVRHIAQIKELKATPGFPAR